MSLFKARDWWSSNVSKEEEFDIGCLVVSKLCSGLDTEQVIIGSHSGILRIYLPPQNADGFKPDQLLVELDLGAPIIQIACGKFISAMDVVALSVLHSRKLSIYTFTCTSGATAHGMQFKLAHIYSHNLQRASFNMCHGPFGQANNKDFVCVQSMDGTITIFEQETFAFMRFLPESLLPGPLAYMPSTDSFITVSSGRVIESYKYQALAVATETKSKEEAQSLKSGKRVAADWTVSIGEQALSVDVDCSDPSGSVILVLGERSVFCVTDFGKLKFMKKLEYIPRCMKLYRKTGESVQYIIASHTKTLMIYTDCMLKWAAQMAFVPVHLDICKIGSSDGGIAAIDEHGHISISYLGTDPAMMVLPSTQYRETKYDENADEIKRYQQIIREKSSLQPLVPKKVADDDVKINIVVPSALDNPSQANGVDFYAEEPVPSLTVKIEIKARMLVSNVRLNVFVEKPLATEQTEFDFQSLSANSPVILQIPIYMKYNFLPASLKVEVNATYISGTGAPRITQAYMVLPIKLVVKPAVPAKTAMYKVTIDTNKPPVNLNDLFPDLLGMNAQGQGAALGFQFFGGPVVTMLASKTSQRYRLQSDDFSSMWLLTKELIDRLTAHFGKNSGLKCTHSGPLPLQEFFESLDAHFEYRMHALKYKELLEQRALQFRAIQRRLLTRFKDKTPSPLAYLDTLLEGTFRQLIAITEHAEDNKKILMRASSNLSSSTRLLTFLIKLSCELSDEDEKVLLAVLTAEVSDNGEQGWEEMVDTALTHQLRTKLSKTAKDNNVNADMISIGTDTTKLKKHIAIFIERLAKGAALSSSKSTDDFDSQGDSSQKAVGKVLDKRNIADPSLNSKLLGAEDTPLGTKFGEKLSPRNPTNKSQKISLPPLNGSSDGDVINKLPPLNGGKLRQTKGSKIEVPDLDDLA